MAKKNAPYILIFSFIISLISCNLYGNNDRTKNRHEKILGYVYMLLTNGHYSPQKFDDNFSKKVFEKILTDFDDDKNVFLKTDIDYLRKKYEKSIDDELKGAPLKSFYEIDSIYRLRLGEVKELTKTLFDKPFNYNTNEKFELDPKKINFPKDKNERLNNWVKRATVFTLIRYAENIEKRDIDKNKDYIKRADTSLEREARQGFAKILGRLMDQRVNRETRENNFSTFVNAIAEMNDPHTNYFSPVEFRSFNEGLSGKFYGIGALLKEDDGKIKVASLVVGMPAWKQGQLKENDEILKIGQGDDEPVDVTGFSTGDAVKLIRGSKAGTIVKLTVKSVDGTIKVIPIERGEISLDDSYAKSSIIEQSGKKIGYIYLPEFYLNPNDRAGRRCGDDVEKEIKKLNNENIDGLIFDLRNNGGGSLWDVVRIVGMLIDRGVVVQIKTRDGISDVMQDPTPGVALYTKPLTVLINDFSASASEIFAAAIQDYNRGIVMGSSTYGKGTVQKQIPLNPENNPFNSANNQKEDLGSLKLTLQKFYRANGGTTQQKGVIPDIVIPDRFAFNSQKEKNEPSSLPWDEIKSVLPKSVKPNSFGDIIKQQQAAIDADTNFNSIKANAKYLFDTKDRPFVINLKQYQNEQKQMRLVSKKLEQIKKANLKVRYMQVDEAEYFAEGKKEKNQKWLESVSQDIYINEAVKATLSLINNELATAKK